MNYLQQFESMLSGLDDSESKTQLSEAFKNVKTDFTTSISARDTAKESLKNAEEKLGNIGKSLGFESDFSIDDVNTKVSSLSNSKELDKLKTDLTAQHETEVSELRTLLQTEKTKIDELTGQNNDMLFSDAISKDGLLSGFSDNPKMRGLVESELKSKLLFQDGKVYVNDGNGNPAKDISSGTFLEPKSVADAMRNSDDWKGFLNPQTQGKNGGGMQSNQANSNANPNRSKMSHAEKGAYIKEYGEKAYLELNK